MDARDEGRCAVARARMLSRKIAACPRNLLLVQTLVQELSLRPSGEQLLVLRGVLLPPLLERLLDGPLPSLLLQLIIPRLRLHLLNLPLLRIIRRPALANPRRDRPLHGALRVPHHLALVPLPSLVQQCTEPLLVLLRVLDVHAQLLPQLLPLLPLHLRRLVLLLERLDLLLLNLLQEVVRLLERVLVEVPGQGVEARVDYWTWGWGGVSGSAGNATTKAWALGSVRTHWVVVTLRKAPRTEIKMNINHTEGRQSREAGCVGAAYLWF